MNEELECVVSVSNINEEIKIECTQSLDKIDKIPFDQLSLSSKTSPSPKKLPESKPKY